MFVGVKLYKARFVLRFWGGRLPTPSAVKEAVAILPQP